MEVFFEIYLLEFLKNRILVKIFLKTKYMAYITKQFLENYKSKTKFTIHDSKSLFESIDMDFDVYDIFISYSSKDLEYVKKLAQYLIDSDFSVYVDDNDSILDKNNVTEETAKRLAKIMDSCKCLIYVFTKNSVESSWCPWEIGYMSASNNFKCAVLPIIDKTEQYIEHREYLLIYPKVEHYISLNNGDSYFYVKMQDRIKLKDYIFDNYD